MRRQPVAERKILAVAVHSLFGKLPPALIDGDTGLARNNFNRVAA